MIKPIKNLKCKKCGNSLTLTKKNKLGTKLNEKTGKQISRGTDYILECIKPRTGFWWFLKSTNPCWYGIGYNDIEKKYAEIRYITSDEFIERCRE